MKGEYELLVGEGAAGEHCGMWGSRGLMTYVFHYQPFSNISAGVVASQWSRGGGLSPPEADLYLRPNCLLNITDHQSCQKKELLCPNHKKEG